jgi:predicted nucleotidyltransferase
MVNAEQVRVQRAAVAEIARRYRAHNVRLFGSVLRGDQHSRSDLDILVDFEPEAGFLDYTGLLEELTELFGCQVDLVPAKRLKPEYREEILAEAQPL